MEKKVYETPEVTKVEYDASDRITATACTLESSLYAAVVPDCKD